MSVNFVDYFSDAKLPCACKGTTKIILCTRFNQTVPALLIDSVKSGSCESGTWKYEFSYNTEDLPEGVTALATADISSVVCEGCLTTWISELIPKPVFVSKPSGSATAQDFNGTGSANTAEIGRISINVANPSNKYPLVGLIQSTFLIELASNAIFADGVTAQLYVDDVAYGNPDSVYYEIAVANVSEQNFIRTGGATQLRTLTIDPGETVAIDLIFRRQVVTPALGIKVGAPYLTFCGMTSPA